MESPAPRHELPQFSLKRLLLSVILISAGLSGIAFSLQPQNFVSLPGVAARIVGGVSICLGVILLVTRRRPTRVLIFSLCGAFAGVLISAAFLPTQRGYLSSEETLHRERVLYTGLALGALTPILLAAIPKRASNKG